MRHVLLQLQVKLSVAVLSTVEQRADQHGLLSRRPRNLVCLVILISTLQTSRNSFKRSQLIRHSLMRFSLICELLCCDFVMTNSAGVLMWPVNETGLLAVCYTFPEVCHCVDLKTVLNKIFQLCGPTSDPRCGGILVRKYILTYWSSALLFAMLNCTV